MLSFFICIFLKNFVSCKSLKSKDNINFSSVLANIIVLFHRWPKYCDKINREDELRRPESSCWSSAASSGYESLREQNSCKSTTPDSDHESESSSDDDDSDWGEDEWPFDRALPLPEWGTERPELCFQDVQSYQKFEKVLERNLKENITQFPYDTLSNFITFSYEYLKQKSEYSSLNEFYRDYDPPLLLGRYTCVGLSMNLIAKISTFEDAHPGLKDAMYQVSCEEEIDQIDPYCASSSPPVTTCEKEHVLVCIRIKIRDRTGVILLDPGYHVAHPITIMNDSQYPHSEPLTISTNGSVTKTYSYEFHNNSAFVLWKVVEKKKDTVTSNRLSLIHVTRPFLSAVDIAERRNLVYPFKSLLHRNNEGELIAGLYFRIRTIETTNIIFFYIDENNKRIDARIPISFFLSCTQKQSPENDLYENILREVQRKSFPGENILSKMKSVAELIKNEAFLDEFTTLNDDVDKISRDN